MIAGWPLPVAGWGKAGPEVALPDRDSQDAAFSGSIPEIYDRCLGPLLFEPYADDLARRAVALQPGRILEEAAGTGIATAAIAKALPAVEIVATDLNQAMLDVAARRVPSGKVRFQAADAQSLPFVDGEFDLVVCQYGVMFFPNRFEAFREVRRVLKPGGHFLFNVWAGLDGNPIARIVEDAVATLFPDDPPRFLSRTPYGHGDTTHIADDLTAAGFADAEIETVILPSRAESARQAAVGFAHGSPLRMEIEARDPAMLEQAAERAATALEAEYGEGPIEAAMTASVVLASMSD
jgi:ubiquinone/menaquinone biosynthesis C-methylase UbiE